MIGKYTVNIIHEKSVSGNIDISSSNLDFKYIIRKGILTEVIPDKTMLSKLIIPDNVISIGNEINYGGNPLDKTAVSIFRDNDTEVVFRDYTA